MPIKFTLIVTNVLMHVCSIDATCEPKAWRRLGRLVNHSRKVTARPLFYRHMGHSREINKNIHQTPLAEAEILCVGDKLKNMDGQLPSSSSEALSSQSVHDNCNESAASCSSSFGPSVSRPCAVSDLEPSDPDEDADERVPQPTQHRVKSPVKG